MVEQVTDNAEPVAPSASIDVAPESGHAVAMLWMAACFLATLACTLLSGNAYYHLDDVTHYLYAAWSWRWPAYLLNDWGRPGFTILYAAVAPFGLMACKILSTVLTGISVWLAYLIARKLGVRYAWLAIPLAFAQPVYFLLAQTTLTETPLAFYLIVAVYLAQRRHWSIALGILSIAFITRHEAVIFAPVFAWFAYRDQQPIRKILWLAFAPVALNTACWLFDQPIPILKYFEPQPTQQYGHGGWLTFFQRTLHAWGPAMTVLAMIGTPRLLRDKADAGRLIAVAALAYFFAQVIVFRFGLFASGGYSRFLIGISPLVAIAAVAGVGQLLSTRRTTWTRVGLAVSGCMLLLWLALERQLVLQGGQDIEMPVIHYAVWAVRISSWSLAGLALVMGLLSWLNRWPTVARALVPAGVVVIMGLTVYGLHRPLQPTADARLVDEMLIEIERLELAEREIVSAHPFIDLRTGRALPAQRSTTIGLIEAAPIGSLIAWERQFAGGEDHGVDLEWLTLSPSFKQVLVTGPLPYRKVPYLYIFEKIATWQPPR